VHEPAMDPAGASATCRALGRLGLLAALCAAAASARADAPPPALPQDTVTLRSGAIYSGRIVEKVPGDHETLQLATGEIKRFDWSDLVPPGEAGARPAAPPESSGDRVVVSLETNDPRAAVVQIVGEGTVYGYGGAMPLVLRERRCVAPCGVALDRAGTYLVAGQGVAPSDTFALPPSPGPLRLQVETGSRAANNWGRVATWLGIGLAVAGGSMGLVAAVESNASTNALPPSCVGPNLGKPGCEVTGPGSSFPFVGLGVGLAVAGAVLLGVGIPLWVINRTRVSVAGGERLAADDAPAPEIRWTPAGLAF